MCQSLFTPVDTKMASSSGALVWFYACRCIGGSVFPCWDRRPPGVTGSNGGFVGRVIEGEEGIGEWSSWVEYPLVRMLNQMYGGTHLGFDIPCQAIP